MKLGTSTRDAIATIVLERSIRWCAFARSIGFHPLVKAKMAFPIAMVSSAKRRFIRLAQDNEREGHGKRDDQDSPPQIRPVSRTHVRMTFCLFRILARDGVK